MAGGNLSPRQKMINMMYLVLTALLALNVSAEILEAFNSIKTSIRNSAQSYSEKNIETKKAIVAKVDEEVSQGNKKNEYVKGLAEEVYTMTNDMVNYIEGVVKELEGIAEKHEDEQGVVEYKAIGETEKNFQYWMGAGGEYKNNGRGAGKAMEFKDRLDKFISDANGFIEKWGKDSTGKVAMVFDPIVLNPKDDSSVPDKSEHKKETWEYFTFHSKPVIADLAMMEKYKLDVQEVQSELLNFLKAKLGAVTFKIDSLIPVDAPTSRVVAAGMKFETKLYVAMSSSEIKPEFSGSGSIQVVDGGQAAMMSMTAPGGFGANQNEKEVPYHAVIKVPRTDGGVEELKLEGKYTVRKPEVVITSASVQNLYYNCGNTINVDVPALGEFYNPVLSASEAEVLKTDSDKRKVTIVPRGKTCVLSVSSNTNSQMIKIDDIKYKVIKPPKPSIVLTVNGQVYNGAAAISSKSNCVVKVEADSDFKNALPKDARYMIPKVELLAQRSLGAPSKVADFSGNGRDAQQGIPIALGNSLKSDPPGTKIYFKVEDVYRINFQNNKVKEQFGERDLYIGAVIK